MESPPAARLRTALRDRGLWALVLVAAAGFHRVLFFSESFFFRDLYLYYLPQKDIFVDMARSGELPLWNPLMHGGTPFFANISQHLLYPPNLLYFLLPTPRAMSLLIAGHVLASSLAVYLLARVLGYRSSSSALAGVIYAYCGPTLSSTNLLVRHLSVAWVPLVVLFWHLYLREGRRRYFVLTVLAGVLLTFAGQPEMLVVGLLTALGWGWADPATRFAPRQRLALWLLAVAAVAGLTAVQLVPTAELAAESMRGEGMSLESFGAYSLHPLRLPELVVPEFLGRPDILTDFWGERLVDEGFPYLLSVYLGVVPLSLALAGALRRGGEVPRRLRLYLAALLSLALLGALGRHLPGFDLLYEVFPPLRIFRYPVKTLGFASLPLALLAAAGLEALFSAAERRPARRVLLAVGTGLGLPMLAAWWVLGLPAFGERLQLFFFGQAAEAATVGLRGGLAQALGILLTATLVTVLAARRADLGWGWLLVGVVLLDLSLAGRRLNPSMPVDFLTSEPPAAARVREVAGEDGRFYRAPGPDRFDLRAPSSDSHWYDRWNQEVLGSYLGTAYGIPMIFHDDFDGLAPRRIVHLSQALKALPWERRLPILSAASVRAIVAADEVALPALERAGVIQNSSGIPFHIYRNAEAAPRARLVYLWMVTGSERQTVSAMLAPGFDPRRHVVLEASAESPELADRSQPECRGGELEVRRRSLRESRFVISTPCTAALVLSEVFYPGWKARLDGRPVPLWRANSAFTAVMVPSGEHEVVWRYAPPALAVGALISLATLAALAAGWRWAGRRSAGPGS